MSTADRWLLPDGVEEMLPPEATCLEGLRRELLDRYNSWGYDLVLPPLVEYLESLLVGAGDDLALQTFKLTDQATGRLMGIRADMTPQVARIDAHTLHREGPTRLCYVGDVLHTKPASLASSRSLIQIGAELYGHIGISSDIEIIELMLETLSVSGCDNVHLDLGHVAIYRALAEQAALSGEQEMALFNIYQRKAVPELQAFLIENVSNPALKGAFESLAGLAGDQTILETARQQLQHVCPALTAIIDDLHQVAATISARHPKVTLYFDLGELRGYHYHTGVVFSAYLPGMGQSIACGGRYDHIGEAFGRARPATGFSTDLACLVKIKQQKDSVVAPMVFAPAVDDSSLQAEIKLLRQQGQRVVVSLPGQQVIPAEMGCTQQFVKKGDRWVVASL